MKARIKIVCPVCSKCGGTLHRVVVGNVIDYRHPSGSCSSADVLSDPKDSWEPSARRFRDLEVA